MKIFLSIILFLGILLESTFISFPLTILLITVISFFMDEDGEIWAFVTGIILDLFIPRTIGIDSLFFLSVVLLGRRYQKKLFPGQFVFQIVFLLIVMIVYTLLFYKNLDIINLSVVILVSTVIFMAAKKIFPNVDKRRRLTV